MELITAREIITGLITLAMYELFFRPLIFKTGIKRSNKKEIGKGTENKRKRLQNTGE